MNISDINQRPSFPLQIDKLLDHHTDAEVANILNNAGQTSGTGKKFTAQSIKNIRCNHGLKSKYERLKNRKLLTLNDLSKKLQVAKNTLRVWAKQNIIKSYKGNERNERFYEWPGDSLIVRLKEKMKHKINDKFIKRLYNRLSEVQYEI